MDSSQLAMHFARASAAAERAAESVRQFGSAVGPAAKQLQEKLRPFVAAHRELEEDDD